VTGRLLSIAYNRHLSVYQNAIYADAILCNVLVYTFFPAANKLLWLRGKCWYILKLHLVVFVCRYIILRDYCNEELYSRYGIYCSSCFS
jgi:hypothetical protein